MNARIQHIDALKYAIANGNLEEVCIKSAELAHNYGVVHFQDAILDILSFKSEVLINRRLVSYLVSRMNMLQNNYYRKNKLALRRLVCEIAVIVCLQVKDFNLFVPIPTTLSINESKLENLLLQYSTEETTRIVLKIGNKFSITKDIIDNILAVKGFDISIPMMPITLSKDPLALVWKVLTHCISNQYINDMFELFLCRYKKTSRKMRAKYLCAVLDCIKNQHLYEMGVFTKVALEAMWKIGYVYDNIEKSNQQKAKVNEDVNILKMI